MENIKTLLTRMADSANAARAHYQIWFTLRGQGKALPEYYKDMNDYRYVDFFHANNAGHYKLLFIELGCLFDTDTRAASMRNLKQALTHGSRADIVERIDVTLQTYAELVSGVLTVRSKLIAHKEIGTISENVHAQSGIKPDEVGKLIDVSCALINNIHEELFGDMQPIAGITYRYEKATFELLKALRNGRS